MLVFVFFRFDIVLYDVFISKDSELLLNGGLLLLSHIEFMQGSMNILHNREKVKRETYMKTGTTYKFANGFFKELLVIMCYEY